MLSQVGNKVLIYFPYPFGHDWGVFVYDIIKCNIQIASIMSSFQFNFDAPPHEENNLQQIMKKFDQNESFQFDKFEPVDHGPHQTSANSDDFFQTTDKKQPQQKRQSAKSKSQSRQLQLQNSRNINEISIIDNVKNQSFRYEKPISMKDGIDTNNQRYQNLQKLLNKAKTNNLDNFYKNLDQQNTYPHEQKFRSKEEFKMYRNQLKTYKKSLEENFQNQNGNYNFKHNQYPPISQPNNEVNHFFANDHFNFKKKQTKPNSDDFDFFAKSAHQKRNMFGIAVQPDDFLDDQELKPQQINKQLRKYQQVKQKQQAGQFFRQQKPKKKNQKEAKKLQVIQDLRADLFETTQQQQKMGKLLNNYQQLKSNFNHLISNLKETNTDQEKIIYQLKNLKVQYENKESRLKIQEQNKKEKQILKEKQKEEKFKKITQIKDEIHKIKQNTDKDLLINKLNEKVQNLQNILKNAIQELHQQKQPKMIPKIINYYNEPQNRAESHRSRASNDVNLSGDEESKSNSQGGRFEQNYYLGPVRKAVKELKEQRRQQPNNFVDQFSSPLQLDLTVQDPLNISRGYSQQLQHPFIPAQHSKQYLPNGLDSNNKLLRRCLTQKSSILFESFQFYVTGKYTITGNERFPVTCEVRVANKCAINLYDIFVIVYGPQAQSAQLQMRPSKIMYDEFKYNTSFLFEVDLSKSCIQVGNFSIQLSYKTDSVNKKKVNFKAILPFAQLIKPEFIYEEQFTNAWNHMENQYYVKPKLLDFKNIRSHEDLKLILPFMEINEPDPNSFSYGIMFSYPKSATMFMLKVTCYVSGKASIHLKSNQANHNVDKKLRQQILDIICYLVYG